MRTKVSIKKLIGFKCPPSKLKLDHICCRLQHCTGKCIHCCISILRDLLWLFYNYRRLFQNIIFKIRPKHFQLVLAFLTTRWTFLGRTEKIVRVELRFTIIKKLVVNDGVKHNKARKPGMLLLFETSNENNSQHSLFVIRMVFNSLNRKPTIKTQS